MFYQLSHLHVPSSNPKSPFFIWVVTFSRAWVLGSFPLSDILLSVCPLSAPLEWSGKMRWGRIIIGYLVPNLGQRAVLGRASSGSLEIVQGHDCRFGMEARLDAKPSFMRDVMGELSLCCALSLSSGISGKSQSPPSVLL